MSTAPEHAPVRTAHVPWLSCVEARVDDRRVGVLRYDVRGTWAVLVDTEVAAQEDAERVGGLLVGAAIELLRARGHRILAACPSARSVLAGHPEWSDGVDDLPVAVA